MLTLKNSSLLELAVMLERNYLKESIDMRIVNVINQVKEDKMYDKFLDVWENLEQGDVIRVRYVNDRTDLKTKDYYYLVVKAPREIGEECKYSFINLEKSAYRGSEINPFPLTEIAFRELFAYSSKTWATHRKPSNTLAISEFEVVDATLQVSHDRGVTTMAEKQQTTQAEVDAHIEKRKKENIMWSSVTALLCLAIFGNIILAGITFGITYGLNKRNDEKELAQIQRDWDITP